MGVKYITSDWDRVQQGIADMMGQWGDGMIDDLIILTNELEEAENLIQKYDSDRHISFQHTSQFQHYQQLFEDYLQLHTFSGQVGTIVDDVIDQRFYEDMDAFVAGIQQLQIDDYTTTNRIGATETLSAQSRYAPDVEVPKDEISLGDLFAGENYFADQIKLEYEHVKEINPDQEFSLEDYQEVALNTHAFEYNSIKDQQYNKEFWVNIGALVVIVGATIVAPPAGIALGAVYGTLELTSTISGKDWVSGRELDTGERAFRGALAPLDIVPGVGPVKKFVTLGRVSRLQTAADLGITTTRSGKTLKQTIGESIDSAKVSGSRRVDQLKEFSATRSREMGWQLEKELIEGARDIDRGWTNAKSFAVNTVRQMQPKRAFAGDVGGYLNKYEAPNNHTAENFMQSKIDDVQGMFGSGGGNSNINKANPEKIINALSNFKSKKMVFGNQQFLFDKKGMKHILERHHPEYWNGSVKKSQTFLDKGLSVEDVENIAQSVMQQNRTTLINRGTTRSYQISGTVNGTEYVVGLNKGRVGQLYSK